MSRFRWVFCQLDSLKKCLTPSDVRKALKSLPKTLDDTYARILLSIDTEQQPKAIAALQWITFSRQPLTIDELAEAVVIDPKWDSAFNPNDRLPDPRWLVELLSSLIVTSKRPIFSITPGWNEPHEVEVVRLAHFSVKEYLNSIRMRSEPASVFHITEIGANQLIIASSLLYIKSFASLEKKSASDQDLDEFPLLQYASRFRHEHARAIQDINTPQTDDLVVEFLVSMAARSSWFRIYYPGQHWNKAFSKYNYDGIVSPLYCASSLGLRSIVKLLLEAGAEVNTQGGKYGTALQAASQNGSSEVVKLLLEAGADLNTHGGIYGTALRAASRNGNNMLTKLLFEARADINTQGGIYGTALQAASCSES
jgi:hypothetical protein